MATQEQDAGTQYGTEYHGALFANEKAQPNHPDYRGEAEVAGVKYRLAAWIRTPRSGGAKYLSIALTEDLREPDATAPDPAGSTPAPAPTQDEMGF